MIEKEKMIKTIILDLGGVYFTRGTTLAIEKLKDMYNLKDRELNLFFEDIAGSEGNLIRLGLITMDQFEEKFYSMIKVEEKNKQKIRYIWFNSYVPHYGMKQIIKQLKEKSIKLIIFSGNIRERIEFLENRYNFLKYFDKAIFSFDYRKNKNDIEFYEELLKHIECKPEEALFIDDQKKNVKIAKTLGLKGLYFYFPEQLIEYLKQFGINIELKVDYIH